MILFISLKWRGGEIQFWIYHKMFSSTIFQYNFANLMHSQKQPFLHLLSKGNLSLSVRINQLFSIPSCWNCEGRLRAGMNLLLFVLFSALSDSLSMDRLRASHSQISQGRSYKQKFVLSLNWGWIFRNETNKLSLCKVKFQKGRHKIIISMKVS